jgi:hypothetical protein
VIIKIFRVCLRFRVARGALLNEHKCNSQYLAMVMKWNTFSTTFNNLLSSLKCTPVFFVRLHWHMYLSLIKVTRLGLCCICQIDSSAICSLPHGACPNIIASEVTTSCESYRIEHSASVSHVPTFLHTCQPGICH